MNYKLQLKRLVRRLYFVFVGRHDASTWKYESCERCGHCFRILWQVRDEKWLAVNGKYEGCFCLDCFIEKANRKGIHINKNDLDIIGLFQDGKIDVLKWR